MRRLQRHAGSSSARKLARTLGRQPCKICGAATALFRLRSLNSHSSDAAIDDKIIGMRHIDIILSELDDTNKQGCIEECIALCREGARSSPTPTAEGWYAFRINLGLRLLDDQRPPSPQDVQEALNVYRELVANIPKHEVRDRAVACMGLGWAYYLSTRGDTADNLRRSVEAFSEALNWYERESDPYHWAAIKAAIAFVYSEMEGGNFRATRLHAIKLNEEALQVFTAADYPDDFEDITEKIGDLKRQLAALE
jgi:hypothetical protein